MKNTYFKNLSTLLLATLFLSTSGVLGRSIEMSPYLANWWRALLASFFLYWFCRYKKYQLSIRSRKDAFSFILGATLMAAHWISYFYALQLANVALAVLSLYTFPVITALLEPLFGNTAFHRRHLFSGILVLVGIYLLMPELHPESKMLKGVLWGVFSAFCYSVRNLVLKKDIASYHGAVLLFYQTLSVSILLTPSLFFMSISGIRQEYPYVLALAILTTTIGHTLMAYAIQYFSVATASILSSIQPIFGIVLAILFLDEIPTWSTFFGGGIILCTAVVEALRSGDKKKDFFSFPSKKPVSKEVLKR